MKPSDPVVTKRHPEYDAMIARFESELATFRAVNYSVGGCVNKNKPSLMTVDAGYYNFPAFDALKTRFETTQNPQYVKDMWNMACRYINSGVDVNGDGFHDWWTCNTGGHIINNYQDYHYEWRAAGGIGQLLCCFMANPQLDLATKANQVKLAEFLRDHVWCKWHPQNTPTGQNIYDGSNTTYMLARLIPTVISLQKFYGGTAPCTPGDSYNNWLTNGPLHLLEEQLLHHDNNANGNCNMRVRYQPGSGSEPPNWVAPGSVDTAHAVDTVQGMLFAADQGFLDNPSAVINCMCGTINNQTWTGNGWNFAWNGTSPNLTSTPAAMLNILKYCTENKQAFIDWALNTRFPAGPTALQVWANLLACCDE